MSQDKGYRVATGPHDWVTVKTAEDAVKLGKAFAVLVADLGVYKAERDRLAAEVEHLKTRPTLANQYSDYVALAAENERLQSNLAGRDAMIMGRDSIIKCRDEEIERLRKLLEMYLKADPLIGEAIASAMLAAKEGKSV